MREIDYTNRDELEAKAQREKLTEREAAQLTVYRIYRDLSDRSGMDAALNDIDDEIMGEIIETLTDIVEETARLK